MGFVHVNQVAIEKTGIHTLRMDSGALPPPLAAAPFVQGTPQPPPPLVGAPARAPGRPAADPEQNAVREAKHAQKRRLDSLLPSEMTDGRIAIYELTGRAGRSRKAKPEQIISFKELERVHAEGNEDTGEYIRDVLINKFGNKGRYLWMAQDNRGRPLTEYGEHEVDLRPEDSRDEDFEDDEEDEEHDEPSRYTPPPPPPPFAATTQIKELISEEKKSSQDTMALMMAMMQNQMQMQMQMMQQQQERDRQQQQEARDRAERQERYERERRKEEEDRRREENERREREAQRQHEKEQARADQQMQMFMQMFTAQSNKPDTITPMLMKMIESKGDRDGVKELMAMMAESSKQSLIANSEANRQNMQMQAEVAKSMISNVMGISQTMVESMMEAQSVETDDPMEKISKVFNILKPALGAFAAPQQAPQPVQQITHVPVAAPPQAPVDPQEQERQQIHGCLITIVKLEKGEVPPTSYVDAVRWIARHAPESLKRAIISGNEETIMSIGAQGMTQQIMGWLTEEEAHANFLRAVIQDVKRVLAGALDEPSAKEMVQRHADYLKPPTKRRAAPMPPDNAQMATGDEDAKDAEVVSQ